MENGNTICQLPDTIVLNIFQYLNRFDLTTASTLCRQWWRISRDEFLWRRRFFLDFKLDPKVTALRNQSTWYAEYRRIVDETPKVLSQILTGHKDEVVHVTFSHDGETFATCSKDCTLKVWSSAHPCQLMFDVNLNKMYKWQGVFISQFNIDDRLLLVSGFHDAERPYAGEIAVFEVASNGLFPCCRFPIKPFDAVYGCWFSNTTLLSGDFHFMAGYNSCSDVRLCKLHHNEENNTHSQRLYRFINFNASSIRLMITSRCISGIRQITEQKDDSIISETKSSSCISKSISIDDRLLIFLTSNKMCIPHVIGFKHVKSELLGGMFHRDVSASKNFLQRQINTGSSNQASFDIDLPPTLPPDFDENNIDMEYLKANFDFADHIMDMLGHVVGISLTADEKQLLVNVRPWSDVPQAYNMLNPPPISTRIELRIIDLETLSVLPKVYRGHEGFSPSNSCFFIFADSCDAYVASGSEGRFVCIWDRTYDLPPFRLLHDAMVTSVSFNPKCHEMLVSVCDDHSVKVWRSKKRTKNMYKI